MTDDVTVPVRELPIGVGDVPDGKPLGDSQHAMICCLMSGMTLKDSLAKCGTFPNTHYKWIRDNPLYAALVEYSWEVVHDSLLSIVIERAREGDNKLLIEALKYVGNQLGKTTSRLELSGPGGGPMKIQADYNEERVITMTQELKHSFDAGEEDEEALGWA
jgi:hypothetical protein